MLILLAQGLVQFELPHPLLALPGHLLPHPRALALQHPGPHHLEPPLLKFPALDYPLSEESLFLAHNLRDR